MISYASLFFIILIVPLCNMFCPFEPSFFFLCKYIVITFVSLTILLLGRNYIIYIKYKILFQLYKMYLITNCYVYYCYFTIIVTIKNSNSGKGKNNIEPVDKIYNKRVDDKSRKGFRNIFLLKEI